MRWTTLTAITLTLSGTGAMTAAGDHGYSPYPGAVATDFTHRHPQAPNRPNTDERAGYSYKLSPFAKLPPRYDHHYTGGQVGGGRLRLFSKNREGRDLTTDGTWGYDYVLFGRRPGRVFLDWWHDNPRQPEMGTYDPDGIFVPDPVSRHFFQKLLTGGREEHGEGGEHGEEGH